MLSLFGYLSNLFLFLWYLNSKLPLLYQIIPVQVRGDFSPLPFTWFSFHFCMDVHLGSKSHTWIVSSCFPQFHHTYLESYLPIFEFLTLSYYPWTPTMHRLYNLLSTGNLWIDCWLLQIGKMPPNIPINISRSLWSMILLFLNPPLHIHNIFLKFNRDWTHLKPDELQPLVNFRHRIFKQVLHVKGKRFFNQWKFNQMVHRCCINGYYCYFFSFKI